MSDINDKTKIPLAWAVAIGMSLVTGVASAAVSQYKISVHDEEIKELKADLKEKAKDDVNRDLSLKEMNGKMDSVADKIDDLKDSVDKLDRRLRDSNHR
jgi:peptidoglycan hydrolase CwlO-like protein